MLTLITLVLYCKTQKNEIPLLFKMIEILNTRTANDLSFLYKFYKYYIPEEYTPLQKQKIFLYFLKFLQKPEISIETKVNSCFLIIYPMLLKSFQKNQSQEIFQEFVLKEFFNLIYSFILIYF